MLVNFNGKDIQIPEYYMYNIDEGINLDTKETVVSVLEYEFDCGFPHHPRVERYRGRYIKDGEHFNHTLEIFYDDKWQDIKNKQDLNIFLDDSSVKKYYKKILEDCYHNTPSQLTNIVMMYNDMFESNRLKFNVE